MKTQALILTAICALFLIPAFNGAGATKKTSSTSGKKTAAVSEKNQKDKKTEKIPADQTSARKLVSDLTTTQKSKMLVLLNEGTTKDLSIIKGVSKTRGSAIEKARPFESIDEVILVKGIGKGTFAEIVSHARSLTARKSSSSTSRKS